MSSLKVTKDSDEELQICREPSLKAWAILAGVTSLGIGAAYYCNDWFLWKLIYISGAAFVGLSCFEDWEECTFNKKDGQVSLKSESAFNKIFGSENSRTVAADLSELVGVSVREEDVRYAGKGYMVVLQFETGITLGIMETAVLGEKSELELLAQKIISFTGLEQSMSDEEDSVEDNTVSSSVIDEENVEEIEKISEDIAKDPSSSEAEVAVSSPIDQEVVDTQSDKQDAQDDAQVTSTTNPQDTDGSSSDEGFEKIEKPPNDVPLE